MARIWFLAAVLAATVTAGVQANSPYAGQEQRDIAALSESDIDDLLAGRGWSLALPAELNGYPGPTHVLELAGELNLDPAQIARVQHVFAAMQADAKRLGERFVTAEAALDASFADGTVTRDALVRMTAEAGRIREELRIVHLAAHLDVKPVLTQHQVALYNQLRGYKSGAAGHSGHSGHGDD